MRGDEPGGIRMNEDLDLRAYNREFKRRQRESSKFRRRENTRRRAATRKKKKQRITAIVRQIVALRKKGYRFYEIADLLGVHRTTIRRYLKSR